MRTRHLLGTAVALAVALSAVVAVPGAGAATVEAHRSHTVTRASKPRLELLAASHDWVVYSAHGKLRAKPVGGGKTIDVPRYDKRDIAALTGNFLIYNGARTRSYLNLRTGSAGRVPAAHQWPWAAPDGGVYLGPGADGLVHGYEQNATSGKVTDFGALPGFRKKSAYVIHAAEADETGIVLEEYVRSGRAGSFVADYVRWAHPHQVTRLDTHGLGDNASCSLTTDVLGCANAFSGGALAYSDSQIVSLPLDGSAPTRRPVGVHLPKLGKGANPSVVPFLTSTRVGWTFALDPDDDFGGPYPRLRLHSVPAMRPHAHHQPSTFIIPDGHNVVVAVAHGGDRLYVVHPTTPGIYTVSKDDRAQKVFLHL